jgi:hypothetical protein
MRAFTEQRKENHMTKLIQICASQNDLFGLDAEGIVHHYNFNTNSWMRLGRGDGERRAVDSATISDHSGGRARLGTDEGRRYAGDEGNRSAQSSTNRAR